LEQRIDELVEVQEDDLYAVRREERRWGWEDIEKCCSSRELKR